ncbi:chemotaxis protein CheW [Bacillus badius]|uniref:Chemotaxis protein CheW n=1 Tax=Bacillus badius TaxID=1455 RepID=A0ABR5AYH8_BACBA|nr:chemotaxis protein CheW [Bacillus badius]KIL75222.1 Positive regulator of CheA protein activity (CheW) [Bacillus badius]KIL79792.1 Positive regulator of CheA protein activity (CheW) [Bacillus badius]KZR60311.1 chemotaxis protein CheW [Bacillus badius]MED4715123.1 chemotaxis protein CheW [Bacillus badius]
MQLIDKVVIFESGREEYAISIQSIISIEKVEFVNPIPLMPAYMRGVTKARGELIPVIDFEAVLYRRPLKESENARLLVVQTEAMPLGFLVKEAKEIIDIPPDSLKQLGIAAYEKTRYFTGIAAFSERLITMIDPDILVSSLEGMKDIQEYMKSNRAPSA